MDNIFSYLVIGIIAVITLYLMSTNYEDIPQINYTVIEKEYQQTGELNDADRKKILEAYQQILKLNNADYKNIIEQIENKIDNQNPDISSVVNELAFQKGAVRMCYLMVKDKLTGSEDTSEFISLAIDSYILMDKCGCFYIISLNNTVC